MAVAVYKTRYFTRIARRSRVDDAALIAAHRQATAGLVDAELGGGLVKQRIARKGQGKSGGHRVIMAFRRGSVTVFLYAFAKNERDNIDAVELADWKDIAAEWLAADARLLEKAVAVGELVEVKDDSTKD